MTAEQTSSAREIAAAMVALTQGKITPDDLRAAMRASREQHGEAMHDQIKARAVCAHIASFGG